MDDAFFAAFNEDLRNREAWSEFCTSNKKGQGKLKDAAVKNPSLLGDPVSLKAENAESEPTDQDKGARTDEGAHPKPGDKEKEAKKPQGKGKLKDAAMKNPSLLGDPVSLKSENANSEPTHQDRGAKSSPSTASAAKSPSSPSDLPPEAPAPTVTSLTSSKTSSQSDSPSSSKAATPSTTPPLPSLPDIDGKALFWQMMDHSRTPDPYIFPALLRLKSAPASQRPILGALSNTVIFPPGHPYNHLPSSVPASSDSTPSSPSSSPASKFSVAAKDDDDPRIYFDVFVASAEVGMRKPETRIYELALKKLDEFDRQQRGGSGIKAEDILFLDDIGENLKTAREMGMQTIKVQMGKTFRAVKELEGVTRLELMDEKTRRSKL